MKLRLILSTFAFITSFCFSQSNNPKISPSHTSCFSGSKGSYIVGKIYVKPVVVSPKQRLVKELPIINSVTISPNPVTNVLTFQTSDLLLLKNITIYSIEGKLVYSNILESNTVDLSFLNAGFYNIMIDNDNSKTFKIIKK